MPTVLCPGAIAQPSKPMSKRQEPDLTGETDEVDRLTATTPRRQLAFQVVDLKRKLSVANQRIAELEAAREKLMRQV